MGRSGERKPDLSKEKEFLIQPPKTRPLRKQIFPSMAHPEKQSVAELQSNRRNNQSRSVNIAHFAAGPPQAGGPSLHSKKSFQHLISLNGNRWELFAVSEASDEKEFKLE